MSQGSFRCKYQKVRLKLAFTNNHQWDFLTILKSLGHSFIRGDDEESQLFPEANQYELNLFLGQSLPCPAVRWITLSMEGTVSTPLGASRDLLGQTLCFV